MNQKEYVELAEGFFPVLSNLPDRYKSVKSEYTKEVALRIFIDTRLELDYEPSYLVLKMETIERLRNLLGVEDES